MINDSEMEAGKEKEFKERLEHLSNEVRTCSKPLEAEIGKLTGIRGELSGIEKELESIKTMVEHKVSDEELEEVEDAVTILEEELEAKRRKVEETLQPEEGAKRAEEYLKDLQYLKAEFENYKRRSEKDKREFADFILRCFVGELLPFKDNLEVAITHAKTNEKSEGLLKGVDLTVKQIEELFRKEGFEEIKAEGIHFDPFRHEIISKEVTTTHPENTVIEVIRKGYIFRGKVIRPAMVKIAIKGKEKTEKKEKKKRKKESAKKEA
jgi:molecular chaperone GrpE